MLKTLLGAKIHRATVTDTNINYIGSVTIDKTLMKAAGITQGEQVHIADITNGQRIITYAIEGIENSGVIEINGAAAHNIKKGDLIILMTYISIDLDKTKDYRPSVVHVDAENKIIDISHNPSDSANGVIKSPNAL